ncbi:CMP-N-acetylneuraminate-beta-1,4-galactoside alpha-2,3-sialyltransferase-like isoform X1 [Carassius auratus]|uniref:CMP-N-acetylneuraminate-beta-1,4-galactoside alpha-2,3-sialyltransferase n=1 Tax=Carassius auratus TaxID=7957 RepID=A0A6P6NU22_CARAU|nr:CMP-N-acetylneuraminate-beta-1,4-galactoside alpha-2,3-sialyltransferase-like isoform X1 [Carassius auratus]XP_026112317.1 CMP-N-acetylneuraminate-beta-1,4-galactoside alpha-2,3-sialyltransferase-like isoform X1 [Carassius auratus]XP_026112326.1 CMP-N-acetylneuraminate-beta-1,4-galactoside alpha-2,3-sialyltransferase-like isoform X1 [Carassius auratus]XP_052415724.1 CMP-N-acetylneuraminate-beta-1,4-galactoside alpha-2,3-sialyltransferase isoform X1 [Carassius gibelio]XP_052415725.1 CMP-N-ace
MIRMKSSRSFIFLLCPVMVVLFLYYSSFKMHLRSPVQKSQADLDRLLSVGRVVATEYDKQGFLTKPDRKLPLELQYTFGNLSKGECKPGYAEAKMTSIYPKFSKPAPMFLDPNFRRLSKINTYVPPFGVRKQEYIIDRILKATKRYSLGSELDSISCKKCIIIGNGGILSNKSLGSQIDQYDVVVRLNGAPVAGFEKDVGSKTTMRITYPEGAIQKPERYEKSSLFVFSAFKPMDFRWLRHMVLNEKMWITTGFWKSVARVVPREPEDMRILNPYFIQEAAFNFIGLPHNNGIMGIGNIPTLGTVAITMALHNCDEVAVAGFGYNMSTPYAPLHYYEKLRMSAIKESWTHNITKEKEFLRKLVKGGVIQDLTHGI